jgi:hypothetical protein
MMWLATRAQILRQRAPAISCINLPIRSKRTATVANAGGFSFGGIVLGGGCD